VKLHLEWTDETLASALARRVVLEMDGIDRGRLRRCERAACNLVFYDTTRSNTRRWHAESPCGLRERQRRYRSAGGRGN
jgi:predicted RNA-binding Zn ribbon-like protein